MSTVSLAGITIGYDVGRGDPLIQVDRFSGVAGMTTLDVLAAGPASR